MSQKNKLKNTINTCFFCGKHINIKSEKVCHRIDIKKGSKLGNSVIICKSCELALQKTEKRIFNFGFDFDIIEKYFKNKNRKYKNLIIYKILKLKRKFEIQQNYLEK